MLAKLFRFHGYSSLKFVYSKGKTARARYLSLKYIANSRREESRVAVVVSKKITKKSPERNRMRRRIYEIIRRDWHRVKPGYDLVVTVFDDRVGTIPSQELTDLVHDMLTDAGVLKN
jgi:ribonuclease P protein component